MVTPDTNKMVFHIRRIKTMAGSRFVIQHNLREKDNLGQYIDMERSRFNVYEGPDSLNFTESYEKMIAEARLTRKIQKNASRTIEFVISASHDYKKDWFTNPASKAAWDRYFSESKDFIKTKYGNVIINSAVHFDETTPHMHILCVPLVKNVRGGLKFSSSEFIGGKEELREAHTAFYEQVGVGFGLDRGKEGSRTRHSDLKSYYTWMEEEQKTFEQGRRDLCEKTARAEALEQKAGEKLACIMKREAGLLRYEEHLERRVPVIPLPPELPKDEDRRGWQKAVQQAVSAAFKKLQSMVYHLQVEIKKWKTRAEKAEHDLAVKPLEEISRDRLRRARERNGWQGMER
jgi:hypothetical protein